MIDADLIKRRIANFWGYGSFKAPVWFVGIEEGLGPEIELNERFRAADGKTTIDMRRDMARAPEHMRWFRPPAPPIQPSWKYPTWPCFCGTVAPPPRTKFEPTNYMCWAISTAKSLA